MCGRFTITLTKDDFIKYLSRYKDIEIKIDDVFLPQYNIAPGENIIVMLKHQNIYKVGPITWGFIPSYIKDIKSFKPLINTREETIYTKNIFKSSVISRRCVIFADSFYEWKMINGKKVPYRIMLNNQELFAFAGIWTLNKNNEQTLYTSSIITTAANTFMKDIHDRMPVILDQKDIKLWLDQDFNQEKHLSLLKPYASNQMKAYQVSPHVNNSRNKDENCILNTEST